MEFDAVLICDKIQNLFDKTNAKTEELTKEVVAMKEEMAGMKNTISKPSIQNGYILAKDDDFEWKEDISGGYWHYVGTDDKVVIPHTIQGKEVTSYKGMFANTYVSGVYSDNLNVTDMSHMFASSKSKMLDLANLNTSNVTNMCAMFNDSNAETLDLSSFDTSKVTNMSVMFQASQATELDLSSFNTSNVTDMSWMFFSSPAKTLDLSNFDTSNVTDMRYMFYDSEVKTLDLSNFDTSKVVNIDGMFRPLQATKCYTRTQEDADRLKALIFRQSALEFVFEP